MSTYVDKDPEHSKAFLMPLVLAAPGIGVHYLTNSSAKRHYKDYQDREKCDACGKPDSGNITNQRCKGCHRVAYCSTECERMAWPSHKENCGISAKVNKFHELLAIFYSNPALLHALRVSLVHKLGITQAEECWSVQVWMRLTPTSRKIQMGLYSGTSDFDESAEMEGSLCLDNIAAHGSLNLSVPLSQIQSPMSMHIILWKQARKAAADAGRKQNPIIVVEFDYHMDSVLIALEISPEAYLSAIGLPTPRNLELRFTPSRNYTEIIGQAPWKMMLNKINSYIIADTANDLNLRTTMGEDDKEYIREMGRANGRRTDKGRIIPPEQ